MEITNWSAYILTASNRREKVFFTSKGALKEDALQRCKALHGVSATDISQLKREWNQKIIWAILILNTNIESFLKPAKITLDNPDCHKTTLYIESRKRRKNKKIN